MEDTTKKLTDHPIIFFGTEDFSVVSLERLIKDNYAIAAVVTKPDMKKGRGQQLAEPRVKTIATTHDIDVWQPQKLDEIIDKVKAIQPVVGVLVSYGKIIPQQIIDLFEPGIINVHPSLLPKYRGPSPIETALLNGDEETGVTLMQLSAKMDAGPLYEQRKISIDEADTKDYTTARLAAIGAGMLSECLPEIVAGERVPTPQDDAQASYCHLIRKEDGIIDWNKSVHKLEREIDVYRGWPGSYTELNGVKLIITSAESWNFFPGAPNEHIKGRAYIHSRRYHSPIEYIVNEDGSRSDFSDTDYPLLFVAAGDNDEEWLEIHTLKPVGKKEMTAREFINGYGHVFPKNSWV